MCLNITYRIIYLISTCPCGSYVFCAADDADEQPPQPQCDDDDCLTCGHLLPSTSSGSAVPFDITTGSAAPCDINTGSAVPFDITTGSAAPCDINTGSAVPFDITAGSAAPCDINTGSAVPS